MVDIIKLLMLWKIFISTFQPHEYPALVILCYEISKELSESKPLPRTVSAGKKSEVEREPTAS